MALAELDFKIALEVAAEFKLVIGFPWDSVEPMAKDLVRWCVGAIVENRVYPPEAQARWLVREARETWDKWQGTAALRQLFRTKFAPPKPGNAFQELGPKPPTECASCNDTGIVRVRGHHRYCDCRLGELMKSDSGENGEKWLQRMDKSNFARPAEPERARRAHRPTLEELEAEYFASEPKKPEED